MGIVRNKKASFAIYFCIEQGVADRNPQVGDLELFILEMDQNYGGGIQQTKLSALPVQAIEHSLRDPFAILSAAAIKKDQKIISTDPVGWQSGIPQHDAHPVQHRITVDLPVLLVERHEIIKVDHQQRKGVLCGGCKARIERLQKG